MTRHLALLSILAFSVCAWITAVCAAEPGTPGSQPFGGDWAAGRQPKEIPQEKTAPLPSESFEVAGRRAFVIMPKGAKAPIPWVWYAPTFTGLPGVEENWMFERFLAAGIAIAGIDVGETMGNPQGRKQYSALYEELVSKRHFTPQPVLLARSRGGLMLVNWAAENPKKVAGITGLYPVGDLLSYPGLKATAAAYGMSEEEMLRELPKHNPVERLKPLAEAKVPILYIHGDRDTLVPIDKNSAAMERNYKALGGEMTLLVQKGHGHDMWEGWFHSQAIVDFAIARAKSGQD
jgi:pimeloyl-ACP methyl ester carboxylesterase